jgi:EAL domain-containing protein (putative c-di-GMP-specific phosphodiesterase class I)
MMNRNLLDQLLKIIDRHNVPHSCIEIELTETTTDVAFADLKRIVTGLQSEGIFASVDDFGIGYSSLNLIRELPWNVLKVDRSLVPLDDDDTSVNSIMFRYVISMVNELGIECIVEGVETAKQLALLQKNNCLYAQGFLFDRPLPVREFEQRMLVGSYPLPEA